MTEQGKTMSQPQTQPRPPRLIVQPGWLAAHLDDPSLRLFDLRPEESYREGHIPGAIHLDLEELRHQVDGVEGMLLPADQFARRLGELGVDHTTWVVAYDGNWGLLAARLVWSLARYGHTGAAILNGGADRWQEEGHPWTQEVARPRPTTFVPVPRDEHLAERAWLRRQLGRADLVVVDTRTPGEYAQGHLPGAVNWDWMNGVPVGSWDAVRDDDGLRTELAARGITPDREVVTYCQSGVRAAHTYLLLRHLGYPRVRNYDGSWAEWSHYGEPREP